MDRRDILGWLKETRPKRFAELWRLADETRRRHVGDEVHLRGLIEISNHCVRKCAYCGIRAGERKLRRYRLNSTQILALGRKPGSGHGGRIRRPGI